MTALSVKFILQLQADVVCFHRADSLYDGADPPIDLKLSQFPRRCRAVTGIMIGKARVPPDSGVNILRKIEPVLVGARFLASAILVNRIRASDHHLRSFAFSS